jgi:ATP-dependent helicase HrpA
MSNSRQPRRHAHTWKLDYPPSLPITARRAEIVRAIREHPVVVLSGETGSGKTTQIPKFCLEAGRGQRGMIACTQPRRVAALSVSRRVAEELDVPWGREVGCKIRFDDHTSRNTAVKFLTDGMLLAEVHGDPELRAYDTIVVDEAHERSLNIDFLLGHLNGLRKRRPDLRIIITSATIDTEKFSAAFGGAPIIEVSGRMYPVEIMYAPPDELLSEREDATRVDAAVDALMRILETRQQGDVLIFMPTERDIRETSELIEGRKLRGVTVLPLFGRLTADEQQRIFAPAPGRKIVVATNIAETSLTIPGIRFVIDGGEARISRYNSRTRTKRLPIEVVSQSSANQRSGRAGRVEAGVCIRLYDEEDFANRPIYTPPEILRANLAEVILRMRAARLGEIETFPFIDPPPAAAIKAGYALLEEIGAIDPASPGLTNIGRELAALPVDPTVGRMLLQARRERALDEVLIIASALGIQDPRDRPLGKEAAADAAHAKFVNPDSDFLTLLNIWEAVHDETSRLPLGRLRKFCKEHLLSFIRMREWHDIHSQLSSALGARQSDRARAEQASEADEDDDVLTVGAAATGRDDATASAAQARAADWMFGGERYRAIHRSILTGLLSNIAVREVGNVFKSTSDRRVVVFPGSALFEKSNKRRGEERPPPRKRAKPGRDSWIACAEVLETQRLYARTAARIDPAWIEELGAHVCRWTYAEPDWHVESARVLVRETVRLHGLEIRNRTVDFGKIDPAAATEIFIRAALVNDTLESPLKFLEHNRRLRARIATIQTRQRSHAWLDLDGAAYRFYSARLEGVSSVHDLNRLWKERLVREPKFLFMDETDLLAEAEGIDETSFPEEVALDNRVVPLDYAYKPGDERDGVTIRLPYRDREKLTPGFLDWIVPGNIRETVENLLRALPKEARQRLSPIAERVDGIVARLSPDGRPLVESLAEVLASEHGLDVTALQLATIALPDHLRVRVEIIDDAGAPIASGRDLAKLREAIAQRERTLAEKPAASVEDAWRALAASLERERLEDWTVGDLPHRVKVAEHAGVPVWAWPAVVDEGKDGVALRLFRSEAEAAAAMPGGVAALVETRLSRQIAWLERDLKNLNELGPAAVALQPMERWREDAFACIRGSLRDRPAGAPTREAFVLRVAECREHLNGIVPRLVERLRETLALRQELLAHPSPYQGLGTDVGWLVFPGFLRVTPWTQLAHLPRYLKAMKLRADRWKQDPGKDHRRAMQVAPWVKAAAAARGQFGGDDFRWLVEEYRVSVFAQELGTARPVSEKKLEAARAAIGKAQAVAVTAVVDLPASKAVAAKMKPVKLRSLGDLGRALER